MFRLVSATLVVYPVFTTIPLLPVLALVTAMDPVSCPCHESKNTLRRRRRESRARGIRLSKRNAISPLLQTARLSTERCCHRIDTRGVPHRCHGRARTQGHRPTYTSPCYPQTTQLASHTYTYIHLFLIVIFFEQAFPFNDI